MYNVVYIHACKLKPNLKINKKIIFYIYRGIINIKIEIDEIKKTVEKAMTQATKYQSEIATMTTDLITTAFNLIESISKMHQPSSNGLLENNFDLPDFSFMMSKMSLDEEGRQIPDFRIGELTVGTDLNQSDLACFGEGDDLQSLISAQDSIINA